MMTMTKEDYEQVAARLRAKPAALSALRISNTALVVVFYAVYPLLLALLLVAAFGVLPDAINPGVGRGPLPLLHALVVPLVSFVLLSAYRHVRNAPRPYEVLDIEPLLEKHTQGRSFPSRHVFSAFMIAMCWVAFFPPVGLVLVLLACCLGVIRVVGGVHWPLDVVVGAGVGIACGIIGFWVLP